MVISSLKQLKNIKGKRVLVRVDFNVPLKNKKITDNSRIKSSGLTLNYLRKMGAKVIVVTHLGRPEGKVVPEFSLKPLVKELSKILTGMKEKPIKIKLVELNTKTSGVVEKMKAGDMVMLENIRFHQGEEKNDPAFAKELASLADLFVLDGFAVAHRSAASVSGVARYLPAYAGFLLSQEINQLDKLLDKPKKPFVAIIGGAKIETKLPVVKNILKKASTVLLGGAIVNTYWQTKGYGVGSSLVDQGVEKKSLTALTQKQVILPLDVIVGDILGKKIRVVDIQKKPHAICSAGEAILDIGPATVELFTKYITKAKTVVWNGAMGYFEVSAFATGTFEVARAVAGQRRLFTLVGGGETLLVMDTLKQPSQNYITSTGGGAMLEYLSGVKLPGVVVCQKK